MTEKRLRHIAIDQQNYEGLSRLGAFHESFNDVIRRLLGEESSNSSRNQCKEKRGKEGKEKVVPLGAQVGNQAPNEMDSSNTSPNTAASKEGLIPNQEGLANVS